MRYLSAITFVLGICFSCNQRKSKPITEFSQNDIDTGILVDVRTPVEFAAGHLEGAVNVDWLDPGFAHKFDTVAKGTTVYLYCQKGGRSARATRFLDSLGYSKVVDLSGGYAAWSRTRSK
ncbi:MAG: rhodanese-like domain-containing protein [Bacteroidota bacterium]